MARSNPPHEPVSEPDLSNRQLGDYVIGRRLGRGGMADVYLATQTSLRRQVAFKVLRGSLAKDETYVRRFHNEAQAAASLVHANIVQIYEVGCIDGIHFIAQEYVDGQNLKQAILRRGMMDVRKAVTIIRQVAAALHKAGQCGIIHRDIKPENILLASTGEVKVVDFGLARVTSDERRVDLTQVGMTLGTPLYMSPEQVEGQALDPRSDLYSFGVMCYEIFAGRPPFEGDNAFAVAVQHLKNEPPRLETVRDDLPGGIGRIVHTLMAKRPEDRYQSAAQMLRDLRAVPIDGMAEWQAADEDWNTLEWEHLAASRIEATQKLATVMLRDTQPAPRWKWMILPALAVVFAFGVGAGAAWLLRPPFVLAISSDEIPTTPPKNTVEEQFYYALTTNNERDFKMVEQRFPSSPQNDDFIRKSKLHLAYWYEENDRPEDALVQLEGLAAQDDDMTLQIRALLLSANILEAQSIEARDNAKLRQQARDNALLKLQRLVDAMHHASRISSADHDETKSKLSTPWLQDKFEDLWKFASQNPD